MSDRTHRPMQSKDSQTGRQGEELCQREPLENPSCLTHLCQLDTMKLACSASYYFFFISLQLSFPVSAFFVICHCFFIHPIRISVFLKKKEKEPPLYFMHASPVLVWVDICMHVCFSEVGLSPVTETSRSDPHARISPLDLSTQFR